jgi:hypothetical protein
MQGKASDFWAPKSPFSNRCASTQLAIDRALLRLHGSDNLEVCEKDGQEERFARLPAVAAPSGAQRI